MADDEFLHVTLVNLRPLVYELLKFFCNSPVLDQVLQEIYMDKTMMPVDAEEYIVRALLEENAPSYLCCLEMVEYSEASNIYAFNPNIKEAMAALKGKIS